MSQTKTIGGQRLGSGNRMNVDLHGYSRSNHDLGHIFKTTMSPGTLIPFFVKPALPGDTWDINLDSVVKTHPTIGPLFASFKLQLDVFTCPIRLYNSWLHNNRLDIGLNMSQIKLPQIELNGDFLDFDSDEPVEFQQINQSSIFAYLGIRGLGHTQEGVGQDHITRKFNAVPLLAYWDIFKNYYANKQEDDAYVITGDFPELAECLVNGVALPGELLTVDTPVTFEGTNINYYNLEVQINSTWYPAYTLIPTLEDWVANDDATYITVQHIRSVWVGETITDARIKPYSNLSQLTPKLLAFPLANIDTMRDNILSYAGNQVYELLSAGGQYNSYPYKAAQEFIPETFKMKAIMAQVGLAVKTYQSDVFNNWIKTDWIEGSGSIADITKISTAGDSFTLDTLNLSKKVYDMLNRIAISGGTYQDWVETVYDNQSNWRAETPIYEGGLSKEIVFQEVISQAATEEEPLGTLAGKGIMSDKHKGGRMVINVSEPSYIIGIVSITPRLDYSQGNEWDSNLRTIDDLHKPALDGIGFQDLIEDQMHFATTSTEGVYGYTTLMYSAGKQPAWINYMTAYNRNYGNFADPRTQMFMTLNRRYEVSGEGIQDLTTYIDPAKFNYAFAQTDLGAMNFWVQIAIDAEVRRKMSAKVIPNL